MLKHTVKKASIRGAFFVLALLIFSTHASAASCSSNSLSSPEKAKVKWVYDGDSLLLTDKRKIRIIGMDTPETKHHKQKAQAYGAKAREALRALLKKFHYRVILRYGKERLDRYSRTLAHVYLPDGMNISNWMLERGYAKTLAFPPNIKLAECYKKAEESAQEKSLRIWRYKSHKVKLAATLPRRIDGYVRLKGVVVKIKHYRKSLRMELRSDTKSHIQLKIKKKNLRYFKKIDPDKLRNKTIIVSGLLKNKKGKRTLYLSYPTQISFVQRGAKGFNNDSQRIKKAASIKWSLQK